MTRITFDDFEKKLYQSSKNLKGVFGNCKKVISNGLKNSISELIIRSCDQAELGRKACSTLTENIKNENKTVLDLDDKQFIALQLHYVTGIHPEYDGKEFKITGKFDIKDIANDNKLEYLNDPYYSYIQFSKLDNTLKNAQEKYKSNIYMYAAKSEKEILKELEEEPSKKQQSSKKKKSVPSKKNEELIDKFQEKLDVKIENHSLKELTKKAYGKFKLLHACLEKQSKQNNNQTAKNTQNAEKQFDSSIEHLLKELPNKPDGIKIKKKDLKNFFEDYTKENKEKSLARA